jgi:glycosyltransferase involved in cell wall biosynthesis
MPGSLRGKYELVSNPKVYIHTDKPTDDSPILVFTGVHNMRASYLRRTIESILNQTHRNFRYLIVDNGSADDSGDIIREYANADKRIEVLTRHKNITGADIDEYAMRCRQEIYDKLTTKYYCLLDSDDYYDDDFLSCTYDLAEKHNADIVSVRTLPYWEESLRTRYWPSSSPLETCVITDDKRILDAMLDHTFIWRPTWGKLIRTSILLNTLVDDATRKSLGGIKDNYHMATMMMNSKTVVMSDRILHYYTLREKSAVRVLTEYSKPVTRVYFLNNWLVGQIRKTGLPDEKNSETIKNYVFGVISDLDIPLLENARDTNPQLVTQTINYILSVEIPENLKYDERMDVILIRLKEIMNDAKGACQ